MFGSKSTLIGILWCAIIVKQYFWKMIDWLISWHSHRVGSIYRIDRVLNKDWPGPAVHRGFRYNPQLVLIRVSKSVWVRSQKHLAILLHCFKPSLTVLHDFFHSCSRARLMTVHKLVLLTAYCMTKPTKSSSKDLSLYRNWILVFEVNYCHRI